MTAPNSRPLGSSKAPPGATKPQEKFQSPFLVEPWNVQQPVALGWHLLHPGFSAIYKPMDCARLQKDFTRWCRSRGLPETRLQTRVLKAPDGVVLGVEVTRPLS